MFTLIGELIATPGIKSREGLIAAKFHPKEEGWKRKAWT